MNMDYCKYENTANALEQCLESWDESMDDASDYEKEGKLRIIEMARDIVRMEDEE